MKSNEFVTEGRKTQSKYTVYDKSTKKVIKPNVTEADKLKAKNKNYASGSPSWVQDKLNEGIQEGLYMVRCIGTFYGGKYRETGVDSIFVLADSKEDAINIAKNNIEAVAQHFMKKRLRKGSKTVPAMVPRDAKSLKISDTAKLTNQRSYNKVLTGNGNFEPVNLDHTGVQEAINEESLEDLKDQYRALQHSDALGTAQKLRQLSDKIKNHPDYKKPVRQAPSQDEKQRRTEALIQDTIKTRKDINAAKMATGREPLPIDRESIIQLLKNRGQL